MALIDLLVVAVGLSMDAFAASICKGLADSGKSSYKKAVIAGLWFGGFQALMPFIGWFLGSRFEEYITDFDHWIAFGLLILIGGNTLREAIFGGDDEKPCGDMSFKTMLLLAIATSIDALAVGVTFALLDENSMGIVPEVLIIGCVTFAFSFCGVKIGNAFGSRYQKPAEITGGIILILLGIKILLEHLGVISF